MHIARRTAQELVVVSGTRWLSAFCAAAALITSCLNIIQHQPKGYFLVSGFLLLVALIMDLRKTFTFDAMQRRVRWRGRTVLKSESGEIPFDDITDIGTQVTSASSSSGAQVPIYRLTIITPQTTIPMAYTYNGQPDAYSALRGQILDFVKTVH
jgi:hypothetical protein